MIDIAELFLFKAVESLEGAESEYANGRYNNCANRCYLACFQAVIEALLRAGIQPRGAKGEWGHAFVQAEFAGQLIRRRKQFPAELGATLSQTLQLRSAADYQPVQLSEREAARALRWARPFVGAIQARGGEPA